MLELWIKCFIEMLFITTSWGVLKKSKDELRDIMKNISPSNFVKKWIFHLALLFLYRWLYLRVYLSYLWVINVFIILQSITGLWIVINKKSWITFSEYIPEIVDKIFPLAYLLYFGYNFILNFRIFFIF
ncbi:MAG: hypothetical protein AB1349_14100 [Elusimicrobiota bacterium]